MVEDLPEISTYSPQARTLEQLPNSSLLVQAWQKGNDDNDTIVTSCASSELGCSEDVVEVGGPLQVTLGDVSVARCGA